MKLQRGLQDRQRVGSLALLALDNAVHRPAYRSDPTHEQRARALVAKPYPVQILADELDGATEFLTEDGEDLSVISPAER